MQNNIPIFLASNDKYAPFVATTIASVCYNTESFCEFYVLDSGISSLNKKRIEFLKDKFNNFSIEYLKVDLNKFDGFKSADYISLDTYSRFFIPLLKPELEKAIYMDVDMIALGDIKKIYDVELGKYALGAVPEEFGYKVKKKLNNKLNNDEQHKYFNAGLLLIDIKKWNKNDITTKLFKIEKEHKNQLTFADQCILNKYFNNNYKQLNVDFNVMNQYLYEHNFNIPENSIIRHFEGNTKPWLTNKDCLGNDLLNFNDFWFFAELVGYYFDLLLVYNKNGIVTKIKKSIKLFDIIPLIKIRETEKNICFKLFGIIPFLTITKR